MRPESKVGILILLFILTAFIFTFKIGGDRLPWQKDVGYKISVFFDSIAGLETKSIVRYAGVEVGAIENIVLEDGKAKVAIRLKPDIQIHEDSVFEVGSMGLMGEKFITIRGGSAKARILKENDEVQGREPVSMDNLLSSINAIGGDIKSITSSIREAIGSDNNENKIQNIVNNIEKLSGSLADASDSGKGDLKEIISNFQIISEDLKTIIHSNESNIDNSLGNLYSITETLSKSLPQITKDLELIMADLQFVMQNNKDDIDKTMHNIASASDDFTHTMTDLKGISEKLNSGEGSLGKLIKDDEFHSNLNKALVDIDKAAVQMKGFLGRSSDYQLFVGYHGEYLSNQAEMKNFFSVKLQPRPDKYYLIELVSSPFGKYDEQEYDFEFSNLSQNIPDSLHFTMRKWDKRSLTYTFQFAKIIHNITLRGGLTESTGGFGIDLSLLRNRLILSFDGWDFSRESNAHFRVGGKINLSSNFYLMGGWDDFLLRKDNQDDYYFGAGVFLEDDDLKMLMGFIPLASGK
jgi:phospholipid/cholesterol/gamma-HCH transport system substrate-binding protein